MMTLAEVRDFLDRHFPQLQKGGRYVVEELRPHGARLRAAFHENQIRPGGTISGPTMMTLADVALYVTILASVGPVALAVTTNLNINFLRKGAPGQDVLAAAKLLKLGKRLAVGEVNLLSGTSADPIAHVTATYSIPNA
jgi:uncharacterized protein (TIGR00369 family)